jgi:hypothetical protein
LSGEGIEKGKVMPKTVPRTDEFGRIIIYDQSEIPDFDSEADEQAWWDQHTLAAELFRKPTDDDDLPQIRKPLRSR